MRQTKWSDLGATLVRATGDSSDILGSAEHLSFYGGKIISLADPTIEGLLQCPHRLLVDNTCQIWIGAGSLNKNRRRQEKK